MGVLDDGFWRQSLQVQREFFLLSVVMLLHSLGLYGLHANGVVNDDAGFLIVGKSGSGKTTLTLGLLQSGWTCLADDALVLSHEEAAVAALALRQGFSCTRETAQRFPALSVATAPAEELTAQKQAVDVHPVFPAQFAVRCVPRFLLFPKIHHECHSQLIPVDETTALLGLIQQSAGILTSLSVARQQVAVLQRLVQQTCHYQLLLGTDVFDAPAAVSKMLWNLRQGE